MYATYGRKGYYQCFLECAPYTHCPWYEIHKAIQQLDKEATELEGGRFQVSSL